ncbi:LysR family transcriptional regulator [Paenibacillus mucilaginosus]|nr:LysR family transcriptional regulator [Paenibacillus mucilaginosus]MCG7213191.1 LysR family transcriptional regulator [Paenibacillus mucilaginosus]WDM29642.1 LysR family transcriptional regulator [Paenibacillus mucilaginosus]
MDLRLMKYFVTVAEELHFSRAAKRLNMAQPPLSQQIKSLETMLGVQLLKRNNRTVELTEPGRVFLEEAKKTLKQAEHALKAAQLAEQGLIGRLSVGFVGSAADGPFIHRLTSFLETYPFIELTLKEMTTSQQLDALLAGEIHAGVLRSDVQHPEIHMQEFTEEPCMLVIPESHPLASYQTLSVHDISSDPFIMPPRHLGPYFHDIIIGFFHSYGCRIRIAQEAIQMHTIVNLVSSGLGIAVVPASVSHFQRPGVVYKHFVEPPPHVRLSAAWRKDRVSQALELFLNHFKA